MTIIVIDGTRLIGKKVVQRLRQLEHEALAASPSQAVNAVTGEELAEALAGVKRRVAMSVCFQGVI